MNDNKLKEWIQNYFEGKVNRTSIFIKDDNFNYINAPRDLKINFANLKFQDIDIISKSTNQIIIIGNSLKLQNSIRNHIKGGFIFIEDKESIENLMYIIFEKNFEKNFDKIKYAVIAPINLGTLLTIDKNDFQRFIEEREYILKTINEQHINLNHEDLVYFLDVYFSKNILIASFAQRLFRLATLDFISSEKRVGGYLSEALNTSSKVVRETHLGIFKNPRKISNIRVYDLNVNQVEENIKIKIAKELLAINLKELDVKRITKITDLPLKTVENLYKSVYLK